MVRNRIAGGCSGPAEGATRRPRGVTAVELLTLVVLLVILAAFAIPSMSPVVLNTRLKGAAWQLAGDLRLARQRAVTNQKRFRICVFRDENPTNCATSVATAAYRVERDDGTGFVSDTGAPLRLPPGVTVSATATSAFYPNGTTVPTSTFCVSNQIGGFTPFKVTVASTGRVRVSQESCSP